VTTDLSLPPAPAPGGAPVASPVASPLETGAAPAGRLERYRRRRRAAEHDRRSARLAELHRIRAMVDDAATLVESGWVRDAWFVWDDGTGRRHAVATVSAVLSVPRPVVGACLVGAVVHAGGGPAAVRTQPVQRALDLLWHTLHRGPDEPVRWCPAPAVRAAHVRDLTGWNDAPRRTREDAVALLRDAGRLADREIERLRGT